MRLYVVVSVIWAGSLLSYQLVTFRAVPNIQTGNSRAAWLARPCYDVLNVKYAYIMELRDIGKHGFLLPADQIIPTGQETYTAIVALARHFITWIFAGSTKRQTWADDIYKISQNCSNILNSVISVLNLESPWKMHSNKYKHAYYCLSIVGNML